MIEDEHRFSNLHPDSPTMAGSRATHFVTQHGATAPARATRDPPPPPQNDYAQVLINSPSA